MVDRGRVRASLYCDSQSNEGVGSGKGLRPFVSSGPGLSPEIGALNVTLKDKLHSQAIFIRQK